MRERALGGSHGRIKVSAMSEILTTKVSELQKPWFLKYKRAVIGQGTYTCMLYEDRARIVDKIMEIFV
jgi:hypothetical protein